MTAIAWMAAALACVTLIASVAKADGHDGTSGGFDELAASQPAAESSDDRVIGRVTGVHGRVYAESSDGTRRRLVENGPIYPGDRLVTHRGGQLGVLSGDHYTGLNEDTELSFALTPGGAPDVRLVRGHVRVLEAGETAAGARLSTPAIEIASASGDVEVYAFPEKAALVSMVCALEGQVQAASIAGESATVAAGGCAIAKGAAGLYAAGAPPAPLPPVGADGGAASPAGAPAQRFASPSDVAGGDQLLVSADRAPRFSRSSDVFSACSGAVGAACAAGGAPPPTPGGPVGPFPGPPPPGLPPAPPGGPIGPFPGPAPPGLP